eukprot:UN02059
MTSKDALSIQARDDGDVINFIFESGDNKRYSNFELKLNDIDQEQLGIPETVYATTIKMPSNEFQRICRDLAAIGDTVTIAVGKDGVKFSVNGDIGSGDITIKGMINNKKKSSANKANKNGENGDSVKVKSERKDNDETQMDEDEDMHGNEDEDIPVGNVDEDMDAIDETVLIELEESVQQTFSLRYLNNFTKATGLSKDVTLRMGQDVPLEVEYSIADFGSLRYNLAPKIDDDE